MELDSDCDQQCCQAIHSVQSLKLFSLYFVNY
jgi:hypothetical protein